MLALIGNIGFPELVVILAIAVLVFGKELPQAASKAYMQVRKLRNAVDDLRRDSGIDRELRNIERTVREAEWEARRVDAPPSSVPRVERPALTPPPAAVPPPPAAPVAESATEPPAAESGGPGPPAPPQPTDGAAS